ncbi:MAG: asparagine synthase (glutamine-hydrolyzing) [Myxococcota bacterium]
MCGIVGIHALREGAAVDEAVLARMNAVITHRGPDSDGFHSEPGRVGLAMRRLAIIDVAGGDQPIANEDETVWTVFNGEIYNFAELRSELESKGHRFQSRTDTEVIVHGYEEWGDDVVTRLRGMFGFALWDARRQRLLLARDRAGIKQLFFHVSGDRLVWGSELKAVLQHPDVERRLRPAAVNHFLTFLYVPEPLTMFEGVSELHAGHLLVAEKGRVDVRPYWRLRYDVDRSLDMETAAEGLLGKLDEAVRMRLISDVPLGAWLSGGIDSGAVVALMARHSPDPVNTFSIGYATGGEAFDERVFARELARQYATDHREFEMEPDLVAIAPSLVRAFDQPSADSTAIPTWYLCQLTRQHVTVALSGLGGDEIAAGYERHRGAMLAERLGWVPGPLRRLGVMLADALPDPRSGNQWGQRAKRFARNLGLPFDERYFEFLAQMASPLRGALLTPEIAEQIELDDPLRHCLATVDAVRDADPLNRALYADLKLYLPGDLLTLTDRISMAHSLEVRVPFLDHELLEYAATIPPELKLHGMERKAVLKRAVAPMLPPGFLTRRKMGFSAPIAVWFRDALRPFVEETLSERAIRDAGVFRYATVRRILDDHFARRVNADNQIWALITFTLWYQDYIASRAALDAMPAPAVG